MNSPYVQKYISALLFFLLAASVYAAVPEKNLWSFWDKSNAEDTRAISHELWGTLLSKYVHYDPKKDRNVIDYEGLDTEHALLRQYIRDMSTIEIVSYNKNEQMAYWINLYNALVCDFIIENKIYDKKNPLKLLRKIKNPWGIGVVTVQGKELTLDDIEHRILRPIWNDDRIYYALTCPNISCGDVAAMPYTGATLDTLLNQIRTGYVNSERGVMLKRNGTLRLSSIYKWYIEDFADNEKDLVQYIIKYSNDAQRVAIRNSWNGRISYWFDWSLNVTR